MSLPSTSNKVHMRVVDVYRRHGDKLAENWIFIDLLHWMLQQGVDVLEANRFDRQFHPFKLTGSFNAGLSSR